MIADLWLLMTLRWQVAWNTFRLRKTGYKILTILTSVALAVMGAGVSATVGIGAGLLVRNLSNREFDAIIPGVILTAVAFLLLLSSFGVALGSLFLTSDLELLMTAPVDRRAVFTSKILDGMALYYVLVAVIALPVLLTYGIGLQYGPLYYFLVLVAIVGTPLLPAGLGALLVMLVARLAPARRVREVLGLMGALFGIACALIGQTSRFWFRGIASTTGGPDAWLENLRGLQNVPLPSMFAGRGLAAAGVGDWPGALVGMSAFLLLTFGFFAGCVLLADNLYAAGWMRMQSSGSASRNKQRNAQTARKIGLLGRASASVAITIKDWKVIPRDLRNFAQILSPLLFLPVIYLNLVNGPSRSGSARDSLSFLGLPDLTGVFIAAGVLMSTVLVFSRLAATGISMEGKSWWLLKAAPISGAELLRGKLLTVLVPFFIVSTLLFLGAAIWRGLSPLWTLYGWYGVEQLGAGMLATELGIAVPWARLDWDDPRKMGSGLGALLSLVTWALLGMTAGGLFCLPLLAEAMRPTLVLFAAVVGAILSSVLTFGVGYLALTFGISRVSNVGEA